MLTNLTPVARAMLPSLCLGSIHFLSLNFLPDRVTEYLTKNEMTKNETNSPHLRLALNSSNRRNELLAIQPITKRSWLSVLRFKAENLGLLVAFYGVKP